MENDTIKQEAVNDNASQTATTVDTTKSTSLKAMSYDILVEIERLQLLLRQTQDELATALAAGE